MPVLDLARTAVCEEEPCVGPHGQGCLRDPVFGQLVVVSIQLGHARGEYRGFGPLLVDFAAFGAGRALCVLALALFGAPQGTISCTKESARSEGSANAPAHDVVVANAAVRYCLRSGSSSRPNTMQRQWEVPR